MAIAFPKAQMKYMTIISMLEALCWVVASRLKALLLHTLFELQRAVSYTHLDVYKRQAMFRHRKYSEHWRRPFGRSIALHRFAG